MSKFRQRIVDRQTNLGKYIADESCSGLYAYVGSRGAKFKFRKNVNSKTLWETIDDLYDERTGKGVTLSEARNRVKKESDLFALKTEAEKAVYITRHHSRTRSLKELIPRILHLRKGYPSRFENCLREMPILLDIPASKLTVEMITAWRDKFMRKPKQDGSLPRPAYVNYYTDALSGFLSALVADPETPELAQNIMKNGFRKLSATNNERERFLGQYGEHEIQAFWRQVDKRNDHMTLFCNLVAYTACRKREILELQWDEIDFSNRTIRLSPDRHKTGWKDQRQKEIHLIDEALIVLEAWRTRENFSSGAIQPNETFVFYNPKTGRHIGDVKTAWATLLKDSGIENLTRHDLRRTAASRMAAAGYSDIQIAKLLDQKDLRSVRIYARLANNQLQNDMKILGKR